MKRATLALAATLAMTTCALAAHFSDFTGAPAPGTVDVSRQQFAHVQCTLTVTTTATELPALWAAAGCPNFDSSAQFAWIEPINGSVWYTTRSPLPTFTTGPTGTGMLIGQQVVWPIEGPNSIGALFLISGVSGQSVITSVELRH